MTEFLGKYDVLWIGELVFGLYFFFFTLLLCADKEAELLAGTSGRGGRQRRDGNRSICCWR